MTRLSRGEAEQDAADLRWYFRDSDGDVGLRSNFGAMVAVLQRASDTGNRWSRSDDDVEPEYLHIGSRKLLSGEDYDLDPRRLAAATRAREVEQALERTPDWARCVLGVAFRYPDGEQRLLAATSKAVETHKRSRSRRALADWLERRRKSKQEPDRREWALLRENMLGVLEEALAEYARGKRLARRKAT